MNMKHFLCLLFCLSFLLFPVYAQESYETYSGDTFKTGDVLTLGDFYLSSTKYSHLKYAYTDTYGKVRYIIRYYPPYKRFFLGNERKHHLQQEQSSSTTQQW